eukprot:6466382-Amphidinium_carterae.3
MEQIPHVQEISFNMSSFGSPSVKPTLLVGTPPWLLEVKKAATEMTSGCIAPRIQLAEKSSSGGVTGKRKLLKESSAYPMGFARVVIDLLAKDLHFQYEMRVLSLEPLLRTRIADEQTFHKLEIMQQEHVPEQETEQEVPEATNAGMPDEQGSSTGHSSFADEQEVEIQTITPSTTRKEEDKSADIQCAHCRRYGSVSQYQNFGCRTYPKFRCRACHAAVRCLERSAKSRGEDASKKLTELRRGRPSAFNNLVLSVRVRPDGESDLPDHSDVPVYASSSLQGVKCKSLDDRKEALATVIDCFFSETGVEDYEKVLWMTERRFRAFMKTHEDYTSTEAEREWQKAMASTTTKRRWKDGQWQVQLQVEDGSRKYTKRGSKRQYDKTEAVSEEEDPGEELTKKMRSLRAHAEQPSEFAVESQLEHAVGPAPAPAPNQLSAKSTSELLGQLSGVGAVSTTEGADSADASAAAQYRKEALGESQLKSMGLTKEGGV